MSLTDIPLSYLLLLVLSLILLSAYFSGSETAMMALNRYRLLHLVKKKHLGARKANKLLRRPDRLLGVILIGNNLVNNFAATVATVIGLRLLGDTGLVLAPVILTLVFLIFAEIAPKTLAARSPEKFAFPSAFILDPLLKLFYPLVYLVNAVSNLLVNLFTRKDQEQNNDQLSMEELRTLVDEGVVLPGRRQTMLLGILDLEKVSVDDIMVPRDEIVAIDIEDDLSSIINLITTSQHTRLPVFKGDSNHVIGMLHLRRAIKFIQQEKWDKAALLEQTREPYFVPEGTPLHTQLFNFQKQKRRIALVVDEYGDLKGLVTLEDILEEIVGEFTTDFASHMPEIHPQEDGSILIEGSAALRDLNRVLNWHLPVEGPRTLNGLILEHLEFIPEADVCLRIGDYLIETVQISNNFIRTARVRIAPRKPN